MARRNRRRQPPPLFQCRVCLEDEREENLISPCVCQGSVKYIHNACLLRWYTLNPETGLLCGICKTECAHEYEKPPEMEIPEWIHDRLRVHVPIFMISITHWMFALFTITFLRCSTFREMKPYYTRFQIGFLLTYMVAFGVSVFQIQNKRLYMQKWVCTTNILLPLFHMYCLSLIPSVSWIGGVSSNLCCFHYFFIHSQILEDMNMHSTIRFTNRRP